MTCCSCHEKMLEVERLKMMCLGAKKKPSFRIGPVKSNNEIYRTCGLYYKATAFASLISSNKDGDH